MKPTDSKMDPRVQAIAAEIDALRVRHGLSRRKLALAAEMHPTQISHFLNAKTGVSVERLMDLAAALGAVVLVKPADDGQPLLLGTVDGSGRLDTTINITELTFPGMIEIQGAFGPFKPGDQLHVREASAFELKRWVLIQRQDDVAELLKCEDRAGVRVLMTTTGDAVIYETARHRIIGAVYGRFEPL